MGALDGVRVIELAGIGPGPFCGMMLADMGAEIIRIDRAGSVRGGDPASPPAVVNARGRRSIGVDLKSEVGRDLVLRLVEDADVVFEGFRPGVAERLGVGPEDCLARNPAIVYGRMTGWGQTGPYAQMAGHDINYIALSGALHAFGRKGDKPTPPANMVGDFGGGAMMLAFGMVSALLDVQRGGKGTVIDAAMTDGSALLMSMIYAFHGQGWWQDDRGVNMLDTGAHFYDVYKTADEKFVSIGAIEPQFYVQLLHLCGLSDEPEMQIQNDQRQWDAMRDMLARLIETKTRAEWDEIMIGHDACYAPVLSLAEAPSHPHNTARDTFVTAGNVLQPAPAPRYSTHKTTPPRMPDGQTDTRTILAELGYDTDRIATILNAGGIA
ncbi:CaiB/BaiF CoA-transferase family protein [uncultured Sulfitobacter sp.]|uniref:CaiB/BaiF CoA transferase family protein n=1 Tax=uncultured Sulfitobacter sp. TaxID=191468 RepID=UPI002596A159|nr:CaiB/BaiF CoA-transferase family protein [uncultured Sulfitobacter sp.]